MSEIMDDKPWGPGERSAPLDLEEHNWTLRFYNGRVLCGEVALNGCTMGEARTYAQNSIRKPITGALLKRRGAIVVRFGTMAEEAWSAR
jgi:hypothetical protein